MDAHPMLKSIAIVLGTYLLSFPLVFATTPLLAHIFPGEFDKGHVPSNPALIASTASFTVVSIFCAWLCAWLAQRSFRSSASTTKHVLWFFVLGEIMGIGFTIPNWSKPWPHWYWISWLIAWPISCWIGLMLAKRRAA
jgi:hypothetical protein